MNGLDLLLSSVFMSGGHVLPGSHVLVEGVPLEPGEFALGTPEHPLALVDFFAVGHQVHIGLRDEIAEVTAPSVVGKIHKNLCYVCRIVYIQSLLM